MRTAGVPRFSVAVVVALVLALAGTATSCGSDQSNAATPTSADADGTEFRNVTRDDPFRVGEATLTEVTPGNEGEFTFKAPPGELLFVFFGYTHCPDVCPTTMSYLKAALDELGPEKADKVNLVMVAIDPERDTPEVMAEFLGFYADEFHAIRTTDAEALATAQAAFGTTSKVEKLPDGKVEVEHSGTAYLVDDQGTVLVEFPFGVSVEDLQHDLDLAIGELHG